MKLIIPSYDRAETIKTPFLEVFKDFEKIILLHNKEQHTEYKKFNEYEDIQIIITNLDTGKAGQIRFAVDNVLKHNEWAVFADDNIEYVYGINNEQWLHDRYEDKNPSHWGKVNSHSFVSRILELINHAETLNAHLVGFLSTNNHYFANKKFKDYGFCHGKLTLWKKDNEFIFDDIDLRSLNDFHNTARHIVNYGVVLVNDYMHPIAKYFQSGGIGSKKDRKQDRINNIKLLTTLYPNLIKTKKRKDHYPDARFVHMSKKNFYNWRNKYLAFIKEYEFDKGTMSWQKIRI